MAATSDHLLGRARAVADRNVSRARRLARDRGTALATVRRRLTGAPTATPHPGPRLAHADALRENGFTVYRQAFSRDECARLAAAFKADAGITEGVKYTKLDATNTITSTRQVLFDPRVLAAVRDAVGPDVRFLQVSDLHYRHDTFGWHRDSVHRAQDSSEAPDWADQSVPFGVVKAILYLEAGNAAMGIMAGSHASPLEMDHAHVDAVEQRHGQIVVGPHDEPNRRFDVEQRRVPLAWKAEVGDVLVFDERMYHAGRRVEGGVVSRNQQAPKFTLSLVFGLDNAHSERMYSYFRYARRELHYRDLPADFRQQLAGHGLALSNGWTNFYERQPGDLRHVYLRDPEQLGPLMAEFAAAGAAR